MKDNNNEMAAQRRELILKSAKGLSIVELEALHADRKHKSFALQNKPAKAIPPPEGVACITCKSAMWFGTTKSMTGYCGRMFKEISTDVVPGNILICDGNAPEDEEETPLERVTFEKDVPEPAPFITD